MNEDDRYLNVIDVESACWRGKPPPGQHNEIIEIGLCVVDLHRREQVDKIQIMVKPDEAVISDFCTELTGHTQADVDAGVSYTEACRILTDEHDAAVRAWASWGDYDRNQFTWQSRYTGTPYPFGSRHTNAKRVFGAAHGIRPPGMARALEFAGLPLQGRHHNGADDAWNIGALVLGLVEAGAWPGGVAEASRDLAAGT